MHILVKNKIITRIRSSTAQHARRMPSLTTLLNFEFCMVENPRFVVEISTFSIVNPKTYKNK